MKNAVIRREKDENFRSTSLVDLLQKRADGPRSELGYSFLGEEGKLLDRLTFRDLDRAARQLATRMEGGRGERCLLLFPPGLDYVVAFFACLYAGVVAVPAYPPSRRALGDRFRSVLRDSEPRWILAPPEIARRVRRPIQDWPEMASTSWLEMDGRDLGADEPWSGVLPQASDLAFLQYTSGSTSTPKGVRVTHGNLLHNERLICRSFGTDSDSVILGWLPLYHDMGLIGNVLQPLYLGAECHLMAPLTFLQRPLRWLEAISSRRATVSGGPNFAYELCAAKATDEEVAALDLSSWKVAFNGSEPVRPETLDAFAQRFGPSGFDSRAFYPCYGLAEATLFVSGGDASAAPITGIFDHDGLGQGVAQSSEEGRRLASSGRPSAELEVAVVDGKTGEPVPEGTVGEIWVSGESIADGYWNRPKVNEEIFAARLPGRDETFLRTGDLGFLADGELFLSGRSKDLLILRGRNVYPQDLERAAADSHPALLSDGGAAFSVDLGAGEVAVLVQEIGRRASKEEAGEALRAIIATVAEREQVQLHEVVLLRERTLSKTSSGKVQRSRCREAWLADDLKVVARSGASENGQERAAAKEVPALYQLVAHCCRVSAEELDASTSLLATGLDSLAAMELAHGVASELGVEVPLAELLAGPTLGELEARLAEFSSSGRKALIEEPTEALSEGQEALFFLEAMQPEAAVYNIARAFALPSNLDPSAFRQALEKVVERHRELCLSFPTDAEGAPSRRPTTGPFVEGGEHKAESWSDETLDRALAEAAWRPFDLELGPLVRLELFYREVGAVALFAVHHLVADFHSLVRIVRELAAELGGDVVESSGPSYDAFVQAEREHLKTSGESLLAAWKEHLEPLPPSMELPIDRDPGTERSHRAGVVFHATDVPLASGIQHLARERGTTSFAVVLTAVQLLLARLADAHRSLVVSPVATPGPLPPTGVVGYRVNPLPFLLDRGEDPGFGVLVDAARNAVTHALAHRDLPFARLAAALGAGEGSSLFRVLFAFYEMPPGIPAAFGHAALGRGGESIELGPWSLEGRTLEERRSAYDLSFGAHATDEGLALALEYDADLFDRRTAVDLLARLERLLTVALADPARPVGALNLLSASERSQLVARAEGGEPRVGRWADGLVAPVLQQGSERPEATAVLHPSGDLSYGELAHRVERLAAALQEAGVEPEERVGVCLSRTPDLVVALLAILRAGAAYVPLDPTYPEARLHQIVQDSGVRRTIGAGAAAHRLGVEVLSPALRGLGAVSPAALDPQRLAYLIYTSGSTGVPKGVAISHGAAAALLGWAETVFGADELEVTLAATSIAFDLSVFEIFLPLALGHSLALADNALALEELPVAHQVTLVNTVPSALDALLEAQALPASVRTVNLAGEALQRSLVDRIHGVLPDARVLNLYGPSEDTTYSTFVEVPRKSEEAPTVGVPVAGTQAWVVDRRLHMRPDGAVGELVLGGVAGARGYLGRAAQTAASFVPDPFSGVAGARLYRTGDLVAWGAGEELRFLGRRDHQVKIRGFRIELGEIEARLLEVSEVAEVAVVAQRNAAGYLLVAYVVAPSLSDAEAVLRQHLEECLPGHMVPALWMVLDGLPRTANGKLDRAKLPEPTRTTGEEDGPLDAFTAPIAALFADLLGLETVGSGDDFFALGGHSLLATRLAARLRRSLGVEVPVSAVFADPTPAALARRLRQLADRPAPASPKLLEVTTEAVPLSPAQERMWLHQQLDPTSPVYHLAGAVDWEGPLDEDRLTGAWGVLLDRHPVLRARFQGTAGVPEMTVAPALGHPLEVWDGQAASAEAIDRRTQEIARQPLDLATEGPLRAVWIPRGPENHRLVLVLHHLVADGESLRLLLHELAVAYSGHGELQPVPDFRSWALGQREFLASHGGEEERWEEPTELPLDHSRQARPGFAGRSVEGWLPATTAANLTRLGRSAGGSLFTALLATFQAFLARLGGTSRPVLGTPLAGRGDGLEGMVGPLVNSVPLAADVHRNQPFRETVAGAVGGLLQALDRQHLAVAGGEAPEVVFTLERPWPQLQLGETYGEVNPLFTETAKFDLTLTVVEASEGDLPLRLEVRRELVDETTAHRWLTAWTRLATAAAEKPGAALGELPWLSAGERHQLLVEWNDTEHQERAEPVPTRLAALAQRTPHAMAVTGEDETGESWHLTYGTLVDRADGLARRLLDLGMGRESVVGVRMERSPELFVALLGVLRAGAAYLPLDPGLPADRLASMVDDASAAAVLHTEGKGWIGIEGVAVAVEKSHGSELPQVDDGQLAYVIYTSGSTGKPKGVMIPHRGLRHLVDWHRRVYGTTPTDRGTQLAGLGFDAAVWEIWPYLTSGATLCAVEEPVRSTPALLAERLRTRRVTGTFLPTPLAEALLTEDLHPGPSLQHVLTGGDRLRSAAGERSFEVLNHYGPTECSVVTTAGPVPTELAGAPPDIGRPIDGLQTYGVDPDLRPVPVGVAGELVIGGVGLARGYLGRPALTAERFIPHPFATEPGERLYRSGDRVRFAKDGRIEFLGRTDRQVKVRGYRIEPGEVEVQLRALPGVDDALVKAHGIGESARLVAYVVASSDGVDAAGLREALRPHLAAYMLPSAFVTLGQWPLTPNGKIDRAALPEPATVESEFIAPRSPFEALLAGLWIELLEVERVGVETPFYELGGNSLQVTRLLARVHETCGVEVPVRDFLDDPTVAGLSRAVAQGLMQAAPEAAAAALSEVRGTS